VTISVTALTSGQHQHHDGAGAGGHHHQQRREHCSDGRRNGDQRINLCDQQDGRLVDGTPEVDQLHAPGTTNAGPSTPTGSISDAIRASDRYQQRRRRQRHDRHLQRSGQQRLAGSLVTIASGGQVTVISVDGPDERNYTNTRDGAGAGGQLHQQRAREHSWPLSAR
jgi:hypothetical protein